MLACLSRLVERQLLFGTAGGATDIVLSFYIQRKQFKQI